MKKFRVLNIILIITIIVLAGKIILNNSTENFITGQNIYSTESIEPDCSYYNGYELKQLPSNQCCYEATLQLTCEIFNYKQYDIKCFTSKDSHVALLLNQETFNECQNNNYDIKLE